MFTRENQKDLTVVIMMVACLFVAAACSRGSVNPQASVAEPVKAATPSPATSSGAVGESQTPRQTPPASNSLDIEKAGFISCGWMGDGEGGKGGEKYIEVSSINSEKTPAGAISQKWTYKPGPKGWAAVGWQYPGETSCNWGEQKGKDLSKRGFTQVTFWAKGVPDSQGRWPTVQFKAGGNTGKDKKYQASFQAEQDEAVTLTAEWKQYSINLQGKDLSQVMSAFTWAIRAKDNPEGATFLLSDITYR